MNRIKLSRLALAALALAALALLFFVTHNGGGPGECPEAPGVTGVLPSEPDAAPVKVKNIPRKRKAARLIKTAAAPEKSEKRRKKRNSRLREPGDAMGGGVYIDSAAKAAVLRP